MPVWEVVLDTDGAGLMEVSRRALLFGLAGVAAVPRRARAASVHVRGTLTASDQEAQEGYFTLCAAGGACHPTDAVAVVVHPKSLFYDDLRAMTGHEVQVSVFRP